MSTGQVRGLTTVRDDDFEAGPFQSLDRGRHAERNDPNNKCGGSEDVHQ